MRSFPGTATAALMLVASLTACSTPATAPTAGSSPSVASSPDAPSPSVSPAPPSTSPPDVPPPGVESSVPTGAPPSKPAGIPKTPTDIIRSPGWTEGTITRGGSGPCYGLVTFDGVEYAMYSDAGTTLAKGDHIRARLTPAKLRISCGDGTPVEMGAIQRFP
jgi:hypothetical protein